MSKLAREKPSAVSSGRNSLRQERASRRGGSDSITSPASAVLPSSNTIRQGEPALKSDSRCIPNQYWRWNSGVVSASHSFSGVVLM